MARTVKGGYNMAVKQTGIISERDPQKFVGLSTDTKPTLDTIGNTLRPGASFIELDTKVVFLFDGISAWYQI